MEKSSFFNSINGDRRYKASDFAEFFNSLVTNGVFPNPSTNLQVIANNDMTITLKAGKAWIDGHVYINTSDLILAIDTADGVYNRIDRLVLRLDTVGRTINAVVKKGTFASDPVAPTLQRDADIYELGIADIYIGKGAIGIAQANITDLRMNTTYCGWVNSLIQADTTAIFNQYLDWYNTKTAQYQADMSTKEADFTNQFNTWFATIKNTLGSDAAGNLLNLINENTASINTLDEKVTSHSADNTKHITAEIGKFKASSSTFTTRGISQTFADDFCTANSLVTISITSSTAPEGVWKVDSENGGFTITSDTSETADIIFDYYIQKAVA